MIEHRQRTPSLARRLLTWYAVAVVVGVLALGVVLNRVLEDRLLDDLTDSLESQALLLKSTLGDDALPGNAVLGWANRENLRVTVVAETGPFLPTRREMWQGWKTMPGGRKLLPPFPGRWEWLRESVPASGLSTGMWRFHGRGRMGGEGSSRSTRSPNGSSACGLPSASPVWVRPW